MKERSKEKIATGNVNTEKKAYHVTGKSNSEIPSKSKTEVKPSKTKTSFAQQHYLKLKSINPKSRSSSLLDKFDHSLKKIENVNENKSDQDRKQLLGKFEKAKKYKSLDQVRYTNLTDWSRTSVAKKVSNVLQQSHSSALSHPNSNQVLLPKVLHSYPSKLNFLARKNDGKVQDFAEKHGAEKSQSFHAIKIVDKARRACKCISIEDKNHANEKLENPMGIFNVHNRSYRQISDPFVKTVNPKDPLWDRIQYLNSQSLGNINNESEAQWKYGSQMHQIKYPIKATDIKFQENKNTCSNKVSFSSFLKSSKTSRQLLDHVKNPNEQMHQEYLPGKNPMKICQCLHIHTEDGLRQFPLQNHANAQEVGQKLFRVKYVVKKDEEEDEEIESKENCTDKEVGGTLMRTDSVKSRINRKNSLPRNSLMRLKNESSTSVKANGGKSDNQKKLQMILPGTESQRRISECKRDKSGILSNVYFETKPKISTEEEKDRRKKTSEELLIETTELKKAKEELEILKNLFSKLNVMDSSYFREPVGLEKKHLAERHSQSGFCKKWRGSQALAEKACQMLKDIEAEERYLKEKNKLRQKIIRHVQNFIKLEFNEN